MLSFLKRLFGRKRFLTHEEALAVAKERAAADPDWADVIWPDPRITEALVKACKYLADWPDCPAAIKHYILTGIFRLEEDYASISSHLSAAVAGMEALAKQMDTGFASLEAKLDKVLADHADHQTRLVKLEVDSERRARGRKWVMGIVAALIVSVLSLAAKALVSP
jgi:hypothetical protein